MIRKGVRIPQCFEATGSLRLAKPMRYRPGESRIAFFLLAPLSLSSSALISFVLSFRSFVRSYYSSLISSFFSFFLFAMA